MGEEWTYKQEKKMATFPMVKTADQLALEESEKIRQEDELKKKDEETKLSTLAAHIRSAWEKAKTAKQTIASEMLESVRQRNGEYSAQKLSDIRKIRSSEVYMMLTNTKCRSSEAWIRDINFQPGQRPWDVECTPDPEIPKEMEADIKQNFYKEAFYQLLMNSMNSGQATDMATIMEQVKGMIPEFEKRLKKLIYDKAMDAAKEMAKEIDDKLVEGEFYEALDQCIWDIVTLKAAFLKGPIPRMQTVRTLKTNPLTGIFEVKLETRVVQQYDRVSPFDIFPSPSSTGINEGDLIEREYFRPSQLDALIGVPGYNETEIRAVLSENKEGKLKDWETDVDQERIEQEQQQKDTSTITDLANIPCLEWWGEVPGKILTDWGLTHEEDKTIDSDRIYPAIGWLINTHVIKAKINPDPIGGKPYSKASFEQFPNGFWGRAIPELIEDIQSICNACARAIVNNVGIASGPQVEANKDRFPPGFDFTLWPWKVWQSDESQMGSDKPALQFWQPPMVVEKLIAVYAWASRLADEYIVPAYAHGDPNVGGAGNALANYERVLTPGGPVEIGLLKKGDVVVDTHGSFSTVVGIYPQGESDIFRISFSNGESIDCDMNHRWSVKTHQGRKFRTLTTKEILRKGLFRKTRVGYRNPRGYRPKWMLPIIDFVEFRERSVKIDPYTMGLLLGDGDARCRVTSMDDEIFKRIPYPLGKKDPSQYGGRAYTHAIKGIRSDYYSYGLKCKSTEKFIPEDYLFNSGEVRLELLRGMMDTDGCCSKQGEVFFSSSSLQLAKDFRRLVKSLGGIMNGIREEEGGDFEIKGRKCTRQKNYRIVFNLPGEKIFHLAKKQERVKNKPKTHQYITGIEYLGKFEATCISVDSKDKLFVCENYIPTHNTASGLSMLMGGSSRGIKDVVKHMDMYLVGPTVERQFYWNIENKPRKGVVGDIRIVTKGSSYLAVKQEQAMRLMEFARNTVNEIDFALQGPDGRRYVLKTAAQSMNIDPDKAFPEQIGGPLKPLMLPPGNNQPAPQNLDAAGNPVKGTETRRFNQGR